MKNCKCIDCGIDLIGVAHKVKRCIFCQKKYSKDCQKNKRQSDKWIKYYKEYRQSDKYKHSQKTHMLSDKRKEYEKEYRKSENSQASKKKYRYSDKGTIRSIKAIIKTKYNIPICEIPHELIELNLIQIKIKRLCKTSIV